MGAAMKAKRRVTLHSDPVKFDLSCLSTFEPFEENSKGPASGDSPSLDIIVQSNASHRWSRKQKRVFQRSISWMTEAASRGCQLFWIMLSTARGGKAENLERDFQELRRRIEHRFKYYIEYFTVETTEGNGVLHQVWGIMDNRKVFISQRWLSEEWEKIHGAKIVYIERIYGRDKDCNNISRYFVSHYVAGQSQLKRMSWSWWRSKVAIGKAWEFYKKQVRQFSEIYTWIGLNQNTVSVAYWGLLKGWREILTKGWCTLGDAIFFINNRQLDLALPCRENTIMKTTYQTIG